MEGPRQVDLVLLDLDGTLVDSESFHFQAYCEAIGELGGRMDAPALTRAQYCFAKHSADGQESFLSAFVQMQQQQQGIGAAAGAGAAGVDAGETKAILLEQIKVNKKRAFAALLEEAVQRKEIRMIPGAQAFLASLREAGIATCIVTHSRRSTFDLMAQAFPCLGEVDLVVTHDDYREAKPSPDG
jgi:beta-phosphoglucomutase-like phosphatase (HAD superfamily)